MVAIMSDHRSPSRLPAVAAALALAVLFGGNALAQGSAGKAAAFFVCHGYGCEYRTKVLIGPTDAERLAAIFAGSASSAQAERDSLRKAVSLFEERSTSAIGIRDDARSQFGEGRIKGQMDCIDESTNTHGFLLYLQKAGVLHHHAVLANSSRGLFVDGRYPHATAVIKDKETGEIFAVDSWFEPGGGPPDIMLLSEWKKRGVMGER
jgi:hypothetical protein